MESKITVDMSDPESIGDCFAQIAQTLLESGEDYEANGLVLKSLAPGIAAALADLRRHGHDTPGDWVQAINCACAQIISFLFSNYALRLAPDKAEIKPAAVSMVASMARQILESIADSTGVFTMADIENDAHRAIKRSATSVPCTGRPIYS